MGHSLQSPSSNYKCPNATITGFLTAPETQKDGHNPTHQGLTMWFGQEEYFSPVNDNLRDLNDLAVPEIANLDCSSNYSMSLMPSFGVSEGDVHDQLPALLPENSNLFNNNPTSHYEGLLGEGSLGVGYYQPCDTGEEGYLCSAIGNYVVANNCVTTTPDTWGFHGHMNAPISGENNVKVGRYSVEEKKDRILRYLKKKNKRNFSKTIKYACRKTLADRRVRIRGRFAKNNEEESQTNNNLESSQEGSLTSSYVNIEKNNEQFYDDEWLQEAMSSLVYGPYISG